MSHVGCSNADELWRYNLSWTFKHFTSSFLLYIFSSELLFCQIKQFDQYFYPLNVKLMPDIHRLRWLLFRYHLYFCFNSFDVFKFIGCYLLNLCYPILYCPGYIFSHGEIITRNRGQLWLMQSVLIFAYSKFVATWWFCLFCRWFLVGISRSWIA